MDKHEIFLDVKHFLGPCSGTSSPLKCILTFCIMSQLLVICLVFDSD